MFIFGDPSVGVLPHSQSYGRLEWAMALLHHMVGRVLGEGRRYGPPHH